MDSTTAFLILLNLVLIESILSFPTAIGLATIVAERSISEQKSNLIAGLFVVASFRYLGLLVAAFLIQYKWIFWIAHSWILISCIRYVYFLLKGIEYRTSYLLLMISIFSVAHINTLENTFSAVAITKSLTLIVVGLLIGIVAVGFISYLYLLLIRKIPFLKMLGYLILGLLSIKALGVIFFENLAQEDWIEKLELYLASGSFIAICFAVMRYYIRKKVKNNS